MEDQYSGLPIQIPPAGTNPVYDATFFNEIFAPVSLLKLVSLLEQELGSQGSDSFLINRTRYYQEIGELAERIVQRAGEKFTAYAEAYRSYARKSNILESVCLVASLLQGTAAAAVVLLGTFLGELRRDSKPLPGVAVQLFLAAVFVAILAQLPGWLYRRTARQLAKPLAAPAGPLYEQLSRDFHAVSLELIKTTTESRRNPVLTSDQAPTLVEIESARVIPSETFGSLEDFLQRHVTSAVGIAGPRGAGKSTLLRWLVYALDGDWIPVYLTAPASYDAMDFMRVIFSETVSAVISRYQTDTGRVRRRLLAQMVTLFRPRPAADDIVLSSYSVLEMISGTRTNQKTMTAGLAGKGVSLTRDRQTSWAERERTHPELTSAFKRYLADYQRRGGRRVVIAIDELDKLTSADEAIAAINGLKDLFHLSNTHFIVSVSEDALHRFAMRGIPVRDVFDSAFDDIVRIQPPSPEDAWKMLAYRVNGFPKSIAYFCYAWAGGLPRDIIRTARACVAVRRRINRPAGVSDVAPSVVRQDVTDAIDATISAALDGEKGMDVAALVAARRNITRKTGLIWGLLAQADLQDAAGLDGDTMVGATMQQGLSVYADLGATVVKYFGPGFDAQLAERPKEVARMVGDLARARAELGSYPPEAQWWLDQAQTAILKQETSEAGRIRRGSSPAT